MQTHRLELRRQMLRRQMRRSTMQFGVFSVSDITRDPVSGETPSEAERIEAVVRVAEKAEEGGLDVFAIGEHPNPPLFSSSPPPPPALLAAPPHQVVPPTGNTLVPP